MLHSNPWPLAHQRLILQQVPVQPAPQPMLAHGFHNARVHSGSHVAGPGTTTADNVRGDVIIGVPPSLNASYGFMSGRNVSINTPGLSSATSSASMSINLANEGNGTGLVFDAFENGAYLLRTLQADPANVGIVVTTDVTNKVINIGNTVTGTNIGAGQPVFVSKTAAGVLQFNSLRAGTNIVITPEVGGDLLISATAPPAPAEAWEYVTDTGTLPSSVILNPGYPSAVIPSNLVFPKTSTETDPGGIILIFDASNGAFRAGSVSGGQWTQANRGAQSVAFGLNNTASGAQSFIGAGLTNTVEGAHSAVVAGSNNSCTATSGAFIGAGSNNAVAGNNSCAFGISNVSGGVVSFVAGQAANDNANNNTFVWADSGGLTAPASNPGTAWFQVGTVNNGVGTPAFTIYTSAAAATGVQLIQGSAAWVTTCDANRKENIRPFNPADALARVEALPIYEYNYKGTDPDQVCRGPTAQDWHKLFPSPAKYQLGIDTGDLDGVSLAAIKGLAARLHSQEAQIQALRDEVAALKTRT